MNRLRGIWVAIFRLCCVAICRLIPYPLGLRIMAQKEMEEAGRLTGKRSRVGSGTGTQGGGSAASASGEMAQGNLHRQMGNLPAEVGMGEFKQPLLGAAIQGIGILANEMMHLKGMLVRAYVGPKDWEYALQGKAAAQVYSSHCKEAAGTGKRVGDCKNYVAVALTMVAQADGKVDAEIKRTLEETLGQKVRNVEREMVFSKAGDVAGLVGYCKVTVSKARCYVNVQGKGPEGVKWADALDKALMLRGERTEDVEAPGPVFKELKSALRQMRVQT